MVAKADTRLKAIEDECRVLHGRSDDFDPLRDVSRSNSMR